MFIIQTKANERIRVYRSHISEIKPQMMAPWDFWNENLIIFVDILVTSVIPTNAIKKVIIRETGETSKEKSLDSKRSEHV